MEEKAYRGSRKNILDLLTDDYTDRMNGLLNKYGIHFDGSDYKAPSQKDDMEMTIRQFLNSYKKDWFNLKGIENIWISEEFKNPTWDLISNCKIDEKPGILLVEAKAHESELHQSGKPLNPAASAQSIENHQRISECIGACNASLNTKFKGFNITIDRCYQLSNRVATAWKLTECGIPTTLLYLGFLGDLYFEDRFLNDQHWQRVMEAHMHGVVPLSFPGQKIYSEGGACFLMLIESIQLKRQ